MKRRYNKEHNYWRDCVLERDECCVICQKGAPYLNAHHLIPNNFKKYSFNIDNGLTLCAGCHTLGRYSAHKHPIWFSNWLKKYRPITYLQVVERIEELQNG